MAEADVEMARIAADATRAIEAAARAFDDVRIEAVVCFGRPAREAVVEAEAYAADLVVCVAAPGAGARAALCAWRVRSALARRSATRLLVLEPARPSAAARRPAALTPPVHLPARHG